MIKPFRTMDYEEPSGAVVWLTGLSSAGKTTIAKGVTDALRHSGRAVELLDGDQVREGLSKDLGFARSDRTEQVRRLAFVSALLERNGIIAVVAAISPFRRDRELAKQVCRHLIEVFVDAPIDVCEARDAKGLYRRARLGELHEFTGIGQPYEAPEDPDVRCDTVKESIDQSVAKVVSALMACDRHTPLETGVPAQP